MPTHSQDAVSLLVRDDTRRGQVEAYISDIFSRTYDAQLSRFMPILMALNNQEGSPVAALGIRRAGQEDLFLETYLDQPIEVAVNQATGQATGRAIERQNMVEIGNFASHTAGGGRLLITALTALLNANGFEWAVFTATPLLQRSFQRLGIDLVHIADADPKRLGNARHEWGRYYDQPPAVMAVYVEQSTQALHRILTLENSLASMRNIWQRAGTLGCQQHPGPGRLTP